MNLSSIHGSNVDRCIHSIRDRLDFYARIQIFFLYRYQPFPATLFHDHIQSLTFTILYLVKVMVRVMTISIHWQNLDTLHQGYGYYQTGVSLRQYIFGSQGAVRLPFPRVIWGRSYTTYYVQSTKLITLNIYHKKHKMET